MKLHVKLLNKNAKVPSFAHATDAGADLHCTQDVVIKPGEQASISTGVAMRIPDGYVGLVWDKSGISAKKRLKVMGGVIDAAYTGEIIVTLANVGDKDQRFSAGDKIAQILIQQVFQPEISVVDSLDDSPRGDGAFGSTGR